MRSIIVFAMAIGVLAICSIGGVGGCGGGSSAGGPDEGVPAESPDVPSAPVITSVTGDGESPDQFQDSLTVTGQNFTEEMVVTLGSTSTSDEYELDFRLDSSTKLIADLPPEMTEGDYELTLVADGGTAIAALTILRGATGPAGPTGPAGLTIAAQYSCGPSGDLDSTSDNRFGQNAQVVRYTDGSYFMSCLVDYLSGTFLYIDTSSYVSWFTSNSVGVASGTIGCVPFYVTANYSISGNSVTYVNQADASQSQTVACVQTYP